MNHRHLTLEGTVMHPYRPWIVCIALGLLALVMFSLAAWFAIRPDKAHGQEIESDTYTVVAGNPDSIHGFLLWLGLLRVAPPDAVRLFCMRQEKIALGIYQQKDGRVAAICVDPNEPIDPEICANWNLILVTLHEHAITCRRPRHA